MDPVDRSVTAAGGRSDPAPSDLAAQLNALADLDAAALRAEWRRLYRAHPPKGLSRDLMVRAIAYKLQEAMGFEPTLCFAHRFEFSECFQHLNL